MPINMSIMCPYILTLTWQPQISCKSAQKSTFRHNFQFFPVLVIKLQKSANLLHFISILPLIISWLFKKIVKSKLADLRLRVKWRHNQKIGIILLSKLRAINDNFFPCAVTERKTQGRTLSSPPLVPQWGYVFAWRQSWCNSYQYKKKKEMSKKNPLHEKRMLKEMTNLKKLDASTPRTTTFSKKELMYTHVL